MFKIYYGNKLLDNIFDIKIDKKKRDFYIKKFDLKDKGVIKDFYLNNINIKSKQDNIFFKKYISKDVYFLDNLLVEEFVEKDINSFNFFETNYEEEYNLYENKINNNLIILKDYGEYISLELITEKINNYIYIY